MLENKKKDFGHEILTLTPDVPTHLLDAWSIFKT